MDILKQTCFCWRKKNLQETFPSYKLHIPRRESARNFCPVFKNIRNRKNENKWPPDLRRAIRTMLMRIVCLNLIAEKEKKQRQQSSKVSSS